MTASVDTVVIGAGVVGLSIARALALRGREVIVLERNRSIGEETSSRNSEVIHAGLYYAPGSLKARLCVTGKRLLYEYCEAKGISYRRCGKVLVAAGDAQRRKLAAIADTAARNGVLDVGPLSAQELRRLEPAVRGSAGLWSPSTGIVDSHALLLALRGDLEAAGGSVAVLTRVIEARREGGELSVVCDADGERTLLRATTLVNAAGLHATRLARKLRGVPTSAVPTARYAKGNYFVYRGKSPFTHLVYPLPEDGGLGIHATLDLAGRARFGPDVEWLPADVDIEHLDYTVDGSRVGEFYRAIRAYWPDLPDGALSPAYAGVRPKIAGPGEPAADFAIEVSAEPGASRVVQLFGIESPGLTASLAIGEHVWGLLGAP